MWYTSYKCVFPQNTYCGLLSIRCLNLLLESGLDVMRWKCVLTSIKIVDGRQHSPSTSIVLIGYMNKFCNRLSVNFISVSCISRRQLFILVRDRSVVLLLWIISFMVTLRLWMSHSYFNLDDSSLIIYKIYNAKNYPNLIMTLQFKSWLVWWSL